METGSPIGAAGKTMALGHCLTPKTKINSKWIKDIKVRPDETLKLLEENLGSKPFDIGLSSIFLHIAPQTRETNKQKKQMEH